MVSRQVSMIKHIIAKTVSGDWIIDIVILIGVPVVRQFFRAEDENRFVAVFVVLNNRQCGEGFAQSHAVCQDASVELFKFIDNRQCSIPLEVIKHSPDFTFLKSGCFIRQNIF